MVLKMNPLKIKESYRLKIAVLEDLNDCSEDKYSVRDFLDKICDGKSTGAECAGYIGFSKSYSDKQKDIKISFWYINPGQVFNNNKEFFLGGSNVIIYNSNDEIEPKANSILLEGTKENPSFLLLPRNDSKDKMQVFMSLEQAILQACNNEIEISKQIKI